LGFAEWVDQTSFPFARCGSLANILSVFIGKSAYETKVDCLMAMLELGTSHNRWYVERIFCRFCGADMDQPLARRLSVEFRASGGRTCRQISHLEGSINFERSNLHPVLVQTLADICS
jgi:hypothetical protein